MNPVIKELVYKKGNPKQVAFIAELGGMDEQEKLLFQLAHEGKSDETIKDFLRITNKKRYTDLEKLVSVKLNAAVLECITGYERVYKQLP